MVGGEWETLLCIVTVLQGDSKHDTHEVKLTNSVLMFYMNDMKVQNYKMPKRQKLQQKLKSLSFWFSRVDFTHNAIYKFHFKSNCPLHSLGGAEWQVDLQYVGKTVLRLIRNSHSHNHFVCTYMYEDEMWSHPSWISFLWRVAQCTNISLLCVNVCTRMYLSWNWIRLLAIWENIETHTQP